MNKRLFLFLLILFLVARLYAQTNQPQLTKAEQKQVIDSISRLLDVNYVFQDVAKKMGALLLSNYNNGTYASVTDPQAFAIRLTGDLQSVSKDKHLNVQLAPDFVKELRQRPNGPGGGEVPPSIVANWKMNNFGFREVKILDGSIAYIDLREFSDPKYAGETAIAAMNFVSNANALIIDLRKNGGGSPAMIQLITSYLFNEEPVHLNNFYFRPTNLNSQTWTLPYVPGKRRPDIDVYVLTSRLTFSAAEEFTYNLKNLKRATVIGEVTGGGANPGDVMVVNDRYTMFLPTGRAINPITNTNWEGTGVKPDIEVPADDALLTAQEKALEKLIARNTADAANYKWALTAVQAQKKPYHFNDKELEGYAGQYGPVSITYRQGHLYFQRAPGAPVFKLIPLTKELFDFEGGPIRAKFEWTNNKISGVTALFSDGNSESFRRN